MSLDINSPGTVRFEGIDFDLEGYLEYRNTAPEFAVVELGHRTSPVAPFLPNLHGLRTYIGFESWLHHQGPMSDLYYQIEDLEEAAVGKNITYLRQPLSGEIKYDPEYISRDSWYEGDYDPETILPDGAADEVFVSNVFGDPHIAWGAERAEALLKETARLIASGGYLVIRETITARYAQLSSKRLSEAGLILKGLLHPGCVEEWRQLEIAYCGKKESREYKPDSFYLFLESQT